MKLAATGASRETPAVTGPLAVSTRAHLPSAGNAARTPAPAVTLPPQAITLADSSGHRAQSSPAISPPTMVRVLLADDHPIVRIGVQNLLASSGRFLIVSEAQTTAELTERTLRLLPDLLLMDFCTPEEPALAALHILREQAPSVRVVLLTSEIALEHALRALECGVRGIVLKSSLGESIVAALLAVAEGSYWVLGRRMSTLAEVVQWFAEKAAANKAAPQQTYHLTPREREVTALIVKGLSNREIARRLDVSEETAKRHLSNVFEKVGVSTRLELAITALAKNLAGSS